MSQRRTVFFRPFPLAMAATALFLLCFAGIPGFRDGAHFYGPLFEFLQSELAAGRFPLWNPYENLGQPLAASPTSLMFYPPLLVTLGMSIMAGTEALTAYRLFMLLHVLLALATCYRLARHWRCGRASATLAALAYALGGNVLFQWHNAPFLIGAAWFPEALNQADRLFRENRGRKALRPAVLFAGVLTMMLLGGDVQAAYHAVLCAALLALFDGVSQRAERLKRKRLVLRRLGRSVLRLAFAGVLAFGLSAVLILPAMELAALSDRSLSSHAGVVLRYSIPPWRLLELFWPGAGGWQLPVNARWFSGISPEYGIWTPSHYMGLFTLPLALTVLFSKRFYRGRHRDRHAAVLVVLLLLFLFGGLGYGFGVYSLLYRLPGYALFRYPAKLFTVTSLLLAILAAKGFDRLRWDAALRRRFVRLLVLLPTLAGIAVVLAFSYGGSRVPDCPLFGPYRPETARAGLAFSGLCVLTLVASGVLCLRFPRGRLLLPVLLAADLFVANAWLSAPVPLERRSSATPLLTAMEPEGVAPLRVYRFPILTPPSFAETSSKDRIAEALRWEEASLFPRFPLPRRLAMINVRGTAMPKEYRQRMNRVQEDFSESELGRFEDDLARLGVRYAVMPEKILFEGERLGAEDSDDWPEGVVLWKLRRPIRRDYETFEPDRLVFEVELEEAETVVLPEQYWPGWQAEDESGKRLTVVCVDEIFRGVPLPAGRHRVTMTYRSLPLRLGAVLTLFTLTVSALLLRVASRPSRFQHLHSMRISGHPSASIRA